MKEEALDAPSLARGSKRSLSGVSPPYAAPLSPKHLRAEAHPSEGTAAETAYPTEGFFKVQPSRQPFGGRKLAFSLGTLQCGYGWVCSSAITEW